MVLTNFVIRHKRVASVLLLVCLVFFNIYALQQQAKAFVLTAATLLITGAVLLIGLIAAGVVFHSAEAAQTTQQQMMADPDLSAAAQEAVDDGELIYQPGVGSYMYVTRMPDTLWQKYKDWVHEHLSSGTNYTTVQADPIDGIASISGMNVPMGISYLTTIDVNNIPHSYSLNQHLVEGKTVNTVLITNLETGSTYNCQASTTGQFVFTGPYQEGSITYIRVARSSVYYKIDATNGCSFSPGSTTVESGVYVDPITYDDPDYDWANRSTGARDIGVSMVPDVVGSGVIETDAGEALTVPDVIPSVVDQTADQVLNQDLVGVPEVATPVDTTLDPGEAVDDYDGVEDILASDGMQTSLKGLLLTKFPFCIPWDLASAFKLIAAPAEAPHFTIDFLAPLPIDWQGSTEITFDMAEYPLIGQVCRWVFTVEFCIVLAVATRKIIHS